MRINKKIGEKLPLSKAIEGKVPVAWEKSKALLCIPYTIGNVEENIDWYTNDDILKKKVKCKFLEE